MNAVCENTEKCMQIAAYHFSARTIGIILDSGLQNIALIVTTIHSRSILCNSLIRTAIKKPAEVFSLYSGKKKPADYLRAISSHRKSYTVIFATFGLIWAAR